MSNVWVALGLTLLAGMATGIGGIIAFFAKRTNYRFLSISTGFSAGVMIYVSFVEIFFKGVEALTEGYGEILGHWINAAAFFAGIALIALIDNLIPTAGNPHEMPTTEEITPLYDEGRGRTIAPVTSADSENPELMRTGLFAALAIGIHNFPEGLVTFLTALHDPALGAAIAIAIAMHNIPEGISVSVPIYYATGNRGKALFYSIISGLAEPIGAAVAYLALRLFLAGESGVFPPLVMGILFAGVAGIMIYISLDELLPTSHEYGQGHDSILGLVGGMAIMALSLLLMQ
jgi:zinc transporter, ZIP family